MQSAAGVISFDEEAVAEDGLGLQDAWGYINAIDFSPIINKLVNSQKWRRTEANTVCQQYRRYLFLLKKYGTQTPLPPSEDIDAFWHQHILDTRKYIAECDMLFGHYLQHYPYYGMDASSTINDLQRSFLETQKRYQQEFAEPLEKIRLGLLTRIVVTCLNALGATR